MKFLWILASLLFLLQSFSYSSFAQNLGSTTPTNTTAPNTNVMNYTTQNLPPAPACNQQSEFDLSPLRRYLDQYLELDIPVYYEVVLGSRKAYVISSIAETHTKKLTSLILETPKETYCTLTYLRFYFSEIEKRDKVFYAKILDKMIVLDAEVTKRVQSYRAQISFQRNEYMMTAAAYGIAAGVVISVIRYVPFSKGFKIPLHERKFWNELGFIALKYATPGFFVGLLTGAIIDEHVIPDEIPLTQPLLNLLQ